MSRFRFVTEHKDTYGVKRLCAVLGVSRSGFYDWTSRGPSAHAVRDAELAAVRELAWIHGRQTWPTRSLLRSAIFDYVEGFYNTSRIKQRLGYRSPAQFEHEAIA